MWVLNEFLCGVEGCFSNWTSVLELEKLTWAQAPNHPTPPKKGSLPSWFLLCLGLQALVMGLLLPQFFLGLRTWSPGPFSFQPISLGPLKTRLGPLSTTAFCRGEESFQPSRWGPENSWGFSWVSTETYSSIKKGRLICCFSAPLRPSVPHPWIQPIVDWNYYYVKKNLVSVLNTYKLFLLIIYWMIEYNKC